MITKMSVVNITGPRDDIDRMADQYLRHYAFHPINALKELSGIRILKPYTSSNPYDPYEARIDALLSLIDDEAEDTVKSDPTLSFAAIQELVESAEERLTNEREEFKTARDQITEAENNYHLYEPFSGIDYPLEDILTLKRIKFRFGRFTSENYQKFQKYINARVPSIFVPSKEEDGYVYGVYFTPVAARQRIDALFYSLAWERIRLPEATGTLAEITEGYANRINEFERHRDMIQQYLYESIRPFARDLRQAKARLQELSEAWALRKYAAITRDEFVQKETNYLVIGWIAEKDALSLANETESDDKVTVVIESDKDNQNLNPPTKLKNNFLVRPFELLTNMYGAPNYNEWDPTMLVAITYSILFGAMFGDVGHGLLLILAAAIGYFVPKLAAAKLFLPVGISSAIFGCLYGSVFGFETIIPALWLRPAEALTTIPFFGSLNTVFIVSVAFGMFLILATMFINVCQRIKDGETLDVLFDKNGIMGIIFYGLIVLVVALIVSGHSVPGLSIIGAIIGISLLLIAFKEPILALIERKKSEQSDGIVMQLVTIFFETFETLLTYFSNTISFVRVGAFALSHGIIMGVVLMFANVESGNPNWLVLILGNLFVVGFEGLVVFIQVLRLEFYELFSHFFKGDGLAFDNIWSQQK